jgi:fibronectin type 3 domain-containing protein
MAKKGIILLTAFMLTLSLNCGKKGPLKLEPERLPKEALNLTISQVGDNIRLRWDFPGRLTDKKTELETEKITRIEVYYSEKEILGGKFRKKSTLLRKLQMNELIPYEDPMFIRRAETLTASQKEKQKKLSFFVEIPFNIKDLNVKSHFFALRYLYGKKKSPLSDVAFIITQTPVKPIDDLEVTVENKVVKLKWGRPQSDVSGLPLGNIAGYKIFKKINAREAKKAKETDETAGEPPVEPLDEPFRKINHTPVLSEYFEDVDTGTDGEYLYYISTVVSSDIESAPSPIVSVQITDIFPPDIPANLVSFKAVDHMFLTWRAVSDNDFSHYRVYRKSTEEGDFRLIADEVTTNQYKDRNVQTGTLYFYAVTAVDTKGNQSEYSNMVKEEF